MEDHRRCEKDTHYVTLNSIKEYKMRQRQQDKMDRDEVYNKMSQNLERVREVARSTLVELLPFQQKSTEWLCWKQILLI